MPSPKARRQLELDLRRALNVGDFELYFQPIINLKSMRVTCFEALIRWNHATRGVVSPIEFIAVAEETGLIVPLGEWAMREACRQAMEWPSDIRVAVNLSPVQLSRGNVVAAIISALASSGLQADRFEIEITESALLEKTEQTLQTLNQLRSLGVRISMDDFGTGYSSLNYLRSFPFDKIKIDKSFVKDVQFDDDSRAIVAAISELGDRFGLRTTAEGVEDDAAAQLRHRPGLQRGPGPALQHARAGRPDPGPHRVDRENRLAPLSGRHRPLRASAIRASSDGSVSKRATVSTSASALRFGHLAKLQQPRNLSATSS